MDKVQFGIVGIGGVARTHHIESMRNIQDAELIAVADINEAIAKILLLVA